MLLSQLEYFRVVAKHEHVSRAAEELRVAQPALSSVLRKLEQELGVPLFERTGRGIILNDAGQRLLAHTDYLFSQIDALNAAMEQTKEIIENKMTISVSNSMFLGGWLHNFVLANPKIRLHQRMQSEEQMIEALLDERIDVAIGEFARDVPGIVRKELVEDNYVFIVKKNHPLAQKEAILFEDIKDANIITLPSNATTKIADRIFAQKGCKPKIVFEGSHRMMTQLGMDGRGVTFSSKQMLYIMTLGQERSEDDDMFTVRSIADVDCSSNLCMCWKEGRQLSYMTQKFMDAMNHDYPHYDKDAAFMKKYGQYWD